MNFPANEENKEQHKLTSSLCVCASSEIYYPYYIKVHQGRLLLDYLYRYAFYNTNIVHDTLKKIFHGNELNHLFKGI